MNLLPDALALPTPKILVHCLPSWQIFRQVAAHTTMMNLIEDGIEDFSLINLAFATSTRRGWGQ
jgi:hypothetical protein